MKHEMRIDGENRHLTIRAMDENFIVYRKMYTAPLTPGNIGRRNPGDPADLCGFLKSDAPKIIEDFFRKQIQIVGSCMILACDGEGVIGKMHFTTREMHEAIGGPERWESAFCYCVEHKGFAPKLQTFSDEELERLLRSESHTLRVVCFNIGHTDPRWHGLGIATALLEYLKLWAHERGWRRIEARSCPDITPDTVVGNWMLRRGPLERRGFRVVAETTVPPADALRRLEAIERFLTGNQDHPAWAEWYARNAHRLATDPVWKSEYDKDFLMACDL